MGKMENRKANLLFNKEKRSAVIADTKAKPYYLNQRTLFSHFFFGPYVFFPIISALTWLGGLLALIAIWVKQGKPRYKAKEATTVFVSDVGAANHTLFICITAVTAGFYILSIFAARWLRHVDRLPEDVRKRERVFDGLAVFFGTLGGIGLILLGAFDAFQHSTIHWSMTVVFILGVAISAIFQSLEIFALKKDHPDRSHLRRSAIVKLVVVTLALALAISFAALYGTCKGDATNARCNKITSAAAAVEWAVAFWLTFYILSLALDLWPAGKTSPRYLRRLAKWQEKNEPHNLEHDFTGRNAFAAAPSTWQGADGRALPEEAPVVDAYPAPTSDYPTSTYPAPSAAYPEHRTDSYQSTPSHMNNNTYQPPATGYPGSDAPTYPPNDLRSTAPLPLAATNYGNYDGYQSARPSTTYGSDTGLVRNQAAGNAY